MLNKKVFSGSAEITDEGIKKHFKNYEFADVLFELVWNGLDAKADKIAVKINYNVLGAVESAQILDNGSGIDLDNLSNSFDKFNESLKKDIDETHGSNGKGRLAFYQICDRAEWYTRYKDRNAKILIKAGAIKDYTGEELSPAQQHYLLKDFNNGTCVELSNFTTTKVLANDTLCTAFSKEFGWFLALNPNVEIIVNATKIEIPAHEVFDKKLSINTNEFRVAVFRWHEKPTSEKSYNYLVSSNNRIVQKDLSQFNYKVTFHTSVYIFSDWIDTYDPNALELSPEYSANLAVLKSLMKQVREFQDEIYKDYLRRYVNSEIERYEDSGYFPSYRGIDNSYAEFRKNNTKSMLKELYLADPTIFNKLKPRQTTILIRMLDALLVSNENDALLDVLEGVLDLESENLCSLAEQIQRATFQNIISTIEILQKRQLSVHKLKELIGTRYKEILETPHLQKIIENNTWLFGAQYTTLGAEEDNFTKIYKNLRDQINNINLVEQSDVFEDADLQGAKKQVDLFLARKIPQFDHAGQQFFKCLIVEIKRPSVSLNKKHLQQLDEYAEIISKRPEFASDKIKYELILIGRKISKDDYQIKSRLSGLKDRAEIGLVTDSEKIKCYVKDWFTIFDEFDLTNSYLLKKLNTKLQDVTDISTATMVKELQSQ